MKPPKPILVAIAQAVERAGGDITDVEDLVAVWERLNADKRGRTARLAHDVATQPCTCTDGGQPDPHNRCQHCHGHTQPTQPQKPAPSLASAPRSAAGESRGAG